MSSSEDWYALFHSGRIGEPAASKRPFEPLETLIDLDQELFG
jgi:hypothetical protein